MFGEKPGGKLEIFNCNNLTCSSQDTSLKMTVDQTNKAHCGSRQRVQQEMLHLHLLGPASFDVKVG